MPFKISLIQGAPVWDSLPVAKITSYPLEPRDYKPFAQARLCISKESIWVRLWAFEAKPSPHSTLRAALNLFPERGGRYLSLSASYRREFLCEVCEGGRHTPMAEYLILPRIKTFESEDLQGLYWGVVFELPRAVLPKVYGTNELAAGKRVTGNLYKLESEGERRHYGCYFPVDFTDLANAYTERYFGDFELVEY